MTLMSMFRNKNLKNLKKKFDHGEVLVLESSCETAGGHVVLFGV